MLLDRLYAMIYNARMNIEYTQFRIWKVTLRKLRRIYAATGESMISIVDRLVSEELKRLNIADDPQEGRKDEG
jgi:hypothetical protein